MTDLFNKTRRYRFGLYVGELESIRKLEDLIFGNARIDLGDQRYAIANELMQFFPILRGKVEEFCRDLNSAVLNLRAKLET